MKIQDKCNECGYWNTKLKTFNNCRVFPTCPAAAPRLSEVTTGFKVWYNNEMVITIVKLVKRFDEKTGVPYNVAITDTDQSFNTITGEEIGERKSVNGFIAIGKVKPKVKRRKRNEKSTSKVKRSIRRRRS